MRTGHNLLAKIKVTYNKKQQADNYFVQLLINFMPMSKHRNRVKHASANNLESDINEVSVSASVHTFVNTFILPERRPVYLNLLPDRKSRKKALERLNHKITHDIKSRFIHSDPPVNIDWKSNTCMISDEPGIDGFVGTAGEAYDLLRQAYFGTILIFECATLAAVKTESPSAVIWLY